MRNKYSRFIHEIFKSIYGDIGIYEFIIFLNFYKLY